MKKGAQSGASFFATQKADSRTNKNVKLFYITVDSRNDLYETTFDQQF